MAEVNSVDWSRSNFGAVEPSAATALLGLSGTESLGHLPPTDHGFGLPVGTPLAAADSKEFSGVSEGSDEAFMEVFAREFCKAYEEESAKRTR